MTSFHFHVNTTDVQERLGKFSEAVEKSIGDAVKTISIATHGYIIAKANNELDGWMLKHFLGTDQGGYGNQNNRNVRWSEIGTGMYAVEIDPKVGWIEEGRKAMFMEWLLKNAKTAKDGSRYKAIPLSQKQGAGKKPGWNPNNPALAKVIDQALKDNKISLKNIEREANGNPKFGVLHHVNMESYAQTADKSLFSKPRSAEDAFKTGLKPHEGIFMGEGLMVVQTPAPEAKHGVRREAITYRVISSKHKGEGRWEYPEVKALNSIPEAYKWAQDQFQGWLQGINQELNES